MINVVDRPRATVLLGLLIGVALAGCGSSMESQDAGDGGSPNSSSTSTPAASGDSGTIQEEIRQLRAGNQALRARLKELTPREPYIVVNTTLNQIYLMQGADTLVHAVCSTGSNSELATPDGSRRWFFSTPRGVFKVLNRMKRPVWVRPDWAFVEEGEPIPPARSPLRYEEGVLGEYGLYFGNGYLIHGTLFQRFLGQSVTHGCIRVGDDDLHRIWEQSKVGTRIFIF